MPATCRAFAVVARAARVLDAPGRRSAEAPTPKPIASRWNAAPEGELGLSRFAGHGGGGGRC
eukprot:5020996-Pyramimonas_sp.AAC.1